MLFRSDAFFVLYGDSFLPIDFGAVERAYGESGKPALMTVLRNADRWDKSNARFDGKTVLEYDKRSPGAEMEYIDYGLSVLTRGVLAPYPDDEPLDLADVLPRLSVNGELAGFEVFERFYEIGSHQGLAETQAYFREVK